MRRFAPPVPRQTAVVRLFSGITCAAVIAITTLSAQIPGRNVNMVAGNTWPDGDPFLQRQNEPSIAASTRNPLHLLAGANDYRTIDLPGLAADETGDAWLGLFKSYDGGQRWTSTLLPGYPQDHSALGAASPIHGYGAGADPVLRAGTNGLVYYAGLAFDRANPDTPEIPGKSAIFVARFIDNNNKEAGDTFEYLGTRAIQTQPGGAGSSFLDKPWLAVDIPRNTTRCTIVTPGEKGPITQSVPAGPVYVAYVNRSTDNKGPRYDIMFSRSTDCGDTWSQPVQVNSNGERANQGAALAIDPRNGNVYIAWRQFDLSDQHKDDAIMVAKYVPSTGAINPPGFAHKFAKPKKGKGKGLNPEQFYKRGGVNRAIEAAGLAPLDQSTDAGTIRFRTNAYPSATVDENGRLYVVWAQRGFAVENPDEEAGAARVLIATSTDGKSFTTAKTVASGEPGQQGHQLMPTITYSGGKLMLVYYDIRETRAQSFTKYIDDKSSFQRTTPEATGLRHTIDLRASMGTPGATPVFDESVRVSDYLEGPRYQGGPNVPWQVNPPNLPMFQQGTAPFIGDYIDITAAPNFVLDAAGKWIYNSASSATPPIFHATWTDNRDVRVPLEDRNGDGNPWNDYTPPGMDGSIPSVFDPSQTVPQCIPGNAGSRNQNIYTARITGGLLAGSPGNSKRLGYREGSSTELMERRFVVFVQNTSDDPVKRFRLTITNQPAGGRASWDQFSPAPLTVIDADVPRRSTASRTVYATSTDPHARITINVAELEQVNGQWVVKTGGLESNVLLNPDIDNPDIDNPDIDNPDIDNPDIDNIEIFNPDIDNPDIDNPDIDNPDIDNPDIDNPDIDNVEVANPDIDNPDIDNPDIDNPDIDNPDIDNPDIDNPDIDNSSLMSDVTWNMTNTGNTTAAYNVNLFFAQQQYDPAIKTQLILYRTYKTPVVQNCLLKSETRNVLVANVPNPQLVNPGGTISDPNDPSATNATIYLAPGESARITLRVFDPHPDPAKIVTVTNADGSTAKIVDAFVPNEDVTPVVQQQAVDTEHVDEGETEPPIVVQFPPPQTVDDTASTAENTPVTFNVLANDSTAFGSTKVISYHPDGMAAHSGAGPGDLVFQPSTGFVYTQRGAVDPNTNALVGRFNTPPGSLGTIWQTANPRTGINYGRTSLLNGGLFALDARADSATFHHYLPMPVISDMTLGLALDTVHSRLYVVHGPPTPSAVSPTTLTIIDVSPSSPTFHAIVGTISLPAGIRAQSVAVNSRTQRVYIATNSAGAPNQGGVYVFDPNNAAAGAVRLASTFSAISLAINEASNLVFATSSIGNPATLVIFAIDGATNAVASVPTGLPMRFGANEERMAIHEASGKVFIRLEHAVVIFDGQRGSPTRNTVVGTVGVGHEFGGTDIAVDQELGLVVTVGNVDFQADIIDVDSNALVNTISVNGPPTDVAIDPRTHRAFVSMSLAYVQKIDLTTLQKGDAIPVYVESGGILLNPLTNKAYAGVLSLTAGLLQLSGAGNEGPIADPGHLLPQAGRYLFGAWHNATNRGFVVNMGNTAGTSNEDGSVAIIDGATNSVERVEDTLPNPFGIGIDQVTGGIYVAHLSGPGTHGTILIANANDLQQDATLATGPNGNDLPDGFTLNGQGALLGFGRHVVVNHANHKVYVMQLGGSPVSLAVLDPATARLTPLDGQPGSPIYTFLNPGACGGLEQPSCVSIGRAMVIRVDESLNRVFVGYWDSQSNVYKIVVLDSATDSVIGVVTAGGHSNRHSASYIAVNEAANEFYVTDYNASTIRKFNSATLAEMTDPVALPAGPSAMAYNATAKRIYVSSIDAKMLTAIDAATMQVISSVKLPLVAYFLFVDEVESRIYTSGGDSPDESGAMIVTDVLGQLGTNVNVTAVSNPSQGGGLVVQNADNSVTYTPAPGFSGPDQFNYTIAAPTGTAIGTVHVNVVPSVPAAIAFADGYFTPAGQALNVAAPGPLANDATGSSATSMAVDDQPDHGQLAAQADGAFTYTPDAGFSGVDSFTYHAVSDTLGATNVVTVTISVADPTNLVVTNTNDSGAGSLRAAMTNAQLEPNSLISFDIDGAGPHTITVNSALPALTQPTIIDGYTQSGASVNTAAVGTNAVIKIEVRGNGTVSNGFVLQGGNSTIRGLAVGNFTSTGIQMDVLGGNHIEGSFIGTDASGLVAAPNGAPPVQGNTNASGQGIQSRSPNNIIGGPAAAARNLISGNHNSGIRVDRNTAAGSSAGTGTTIINNLIGTDATGNASLPNGPPGFTTGGGVFVLVPNVTVGGVTANLRNVISGNNGTGVNSFALTTGPSPQVVVSVPSSMTVQGNYIGVRADGTDRLPNTGSGVFVTGANGLIGGSVGTTPGGACTGACNVISGNNNNGLSLSSSTDNAAQIVITSAAAAVVEGNYIGVGPDGMTRMQNGFTGVMVNAPNARVGGSTPQQRNVISGNSGVGIAVGANTFGNTVVSTMGSGAVISGNYIGVDTTGMGAVSNNNGITANVPNIRIGGTNPGERNIISGNTFAGINSNASTTGTSPNVTVLAIPSDLTVQGNYIGVAVDGVTARPNNAGMFINGPNALIGGTVAGAGNVISGNIGTGVFIGTHFENSNAVPPPANQGQIYSSATGAKVYGNLIGVSADGTVAVPNTFVGVTVNAENADIGSDQPGARNIISGNGNAGITVGANYVNSNNQVRSTGAGTKIRGNYIGLNQAGNAMLANGQNGISAGVANVTIGGPNVADANYIVSNLNQRSISFDRWLAGAGVVIDAGGSSTAQGNVLGLDVNGNRLNARGTPIGIGTANNTIIGNTIAGNGTGAFPTTIMIAVSPNAAGTAHHNVIRGNFIGTTATGAPGLHNFGAGVSVFNADDTTIDANTIVGGNDIALFVTAGPGGTSNNTQIKGNRIGLMPDGQTAQDPAHPATIGVFLMANGGSITGSVIGGAAPADRNVIGAVTQNAIDLYNSGVSNTTVQGNYLGVAADGTTARNNGAGGIFVLDATDNVLDGNLITNHAQFGIAVTSAGIRNRIVNNRIFGNGGRGIDFDAGANGGVTAPSLNNANNGGGGATEVTVDLAAAGQWTLQFFANQSCDPSGFGEGDRLVGTRVINGPGATIVSLDELVPATEFLTATATDGVGNTTAFSNCVPVSANNGFVVTNTNDSGAGSLRQAIINANNTAVAATISFDIPGASAASPAIINITEALPQITHAMTIDGTTQAGYDGLPVVEVRGAGGVNAPGFDIEASNVTIRGLAITSFTDGVFAFQTLGGILIENNIIGTNRSGQGDIGNGIGVSFRSGGSTIQSNVISGNGQGLVLHLGGSNNTVINNRIGTTPDGLAARGNAGAGIVLYDGANGNNINANLISGNLAWGIEIQHNGDLAPVQNTDVRSNTIGLNLTGAALANLGGGIKIQNAPGTVIGAPGGRNVISGNGGVGPQIGVGIQVVGTPAVLPVIQSNYIGLDPTGMLARSNNNKGMVLDGPAIVGGIVAGEGNWIAGNGDIAGGAGIIINPGADNTQVFGNTIGLNINNDAVGNGYAGITVRSSGMVQIGHPNFVAGRNIISGNGAFGISIIKVLPTDTPSNVFIRNNVIGSDQSLALQRGNGQAGININDGSSIHVGQSGAGNTVVFNGNQGIRVANATTAEIRQNSIHDNGGLGIDLGGDGVTANDGAADADNGANGLQNYPPLVSATNSGATTTVEFSANDFNPGQPIVVEFFSSASCNVSGRGEGATFQGSTSVNGGAGASLTFNLNQLVPVGHVVTATATDQFGNTSEFSNCVAVANSGNFSIAGAVQYSATPLSNVQVDLIADNVNNAPSQTVQTDGVGQFTFANLPNGTYWVKAFGPDPSYIIWTASQVVVNGANVNQTVQIAKKISAIAPFNGQNNASAKPDLSWSAIPEATRYTIQINRTSDWQQYDIGAESVTNAYTVQQLLDGNTQFTLNIDGYDAANRWVGSTSGGWSFTTIAPMVINLPGTAGGFANLNCCAPGSNNTGSAPAQPTTLAPFEKVYISASGEVGWFPDPATTGPNGVGAPADNLSLAPGLPAISLVAQIAGAGWQYIGAGVTMIQAGPAGGLLEFAVNDSNFADNFGSWTVTIQK